MSPPNAPSPLHAAAEQIEAHVGAAGWDRRPEVFALVPVGRLRDDDAALAERLGLSDAPGHALTPIEQEPLSDVPVDEALARIAWPDAVAGAALSQEIVILPPTVQAELPDDEAAAATLAANHPQRQEARLVVAVLRDGTAAALLRMRPREGGGDSGGDLLTGPDLAPNLVAALLATFEN